MAKKTYQRQSKHKTLGQTLNGILIGLVLGAIIIAVLLWFLNKQKVPTEPPRASQPEKTEIMVPNGSGTTSNPPVVAPASDPTTIPSITPSTASEVAPDDEDTTGVPAISKPPVDKKPVNKTPDAAKKDTIKPAVKPTPEQILESGSVEKARALAAKEAEAKKRAEAAPKKDAPATGRSVKLQAGSFATAEQAEAQRAKLALLGISSHVESGQANGKTVHRVRTNTLNESKADSVRKQLSNNGIETIVIGAGK